MDVQSYLNGEDLPMEIFPELFDEDDAFDICYDCEWSDI